MDDIPKGWKLEAVPPPEFFLRGGSEKYREGWDRIFGKMTVPVDSGINPSSINASPGVIVREGSDG